MVEPVMVGADVRVYCMSELWYMYDVCAQIEDIFRFRRDRLGFYAEIQITFGTVYILAAIQITFGTVYMLGQAGRQAAWQACGQLTNMVCKISQ